QMNPHFMFNSLNSIQEFINRNDKHSANTYLTRFAALIRSILNTSSEDRILLSEEIRQLENYLELEKLRLEGSLDYEVKVDPLIDPDWTFLPTMLIQPYVENAILHGLFHKTGPKRLELSFTRLDEQLLLCRITDNGIGRKLAASIKLERYGRHQSMGSSMTGQRMELLQKLQKQPVSVRIVDLEDPSTGAPLGTEVELTIPEINP
ncbi:MAG: histidine kinase, partial [Saprospiraceae bacterium]|nr:histidine kinase [Saprospiraceae bacterium]